MKIMRLARENGKLSWEGAAISIYPDFSPGIVKKRREFDAVKKKLREANIRYFLQYPSTLSVTVDGKQKLFRSPKEAAVFFANFPAVSDQGRE